MKTIKYITAKRLAMSNTEIGRRLLYLLGVHVTVWMAVVTFAINVQQSLILA